MNLLVSAWTIGLILSLLALGTYISFRIFAFPDITVDGSLTLGAAVSAILIVKGQNPLWATAAGAFGNDARRYADMIDPPNSTKCLDAA